MERLKTIDYVSGLTHKDVREAINANSEVANANFDELEAGMQEAAGGASDAAEAAAAAQTAADAAAKAAQGATETAQAADAAAGEAKQTAEAAKSTAEGAAEAAAEAQRVAGEAEGAAEGAAATAEAAQEAAAGAQGTAETAARDAATAKQDAATAKSDAASAKSTAEGAQSTAETAGRNAAQAVETAGEAQTAANAAQEAAGAAQTAAEGAQRTAETANATAGAAKTAADGAVKDAQAAKSTAEAAKTAASTASQTASTAKSTADTAKQTADTAKSTAEGAVASAEAAQGSADDVAGVIGGGYATFVEKMVLNETQEDVTLGRFNMGKVKEGEILPMNGTITLVVCYDGSAIDDTGVVSVIATLGASKYASMIDRKKLPSGTGKTVCKLTNTYAGLPAAVEGGMAVELRLATDTASTKTAYWAILYESDPYGNPRRRGGSIRRFYEQLNTVSIPSTTVDVVGAGSYLGTPRYNGRTGWFELNGLTDITWDTMEAIAADTEFNSVYPNNFSRKSNIRTNKVGWHHGNTAGSVANFLAHYYQGMEVVAIPTAGYNTPQLLVNNSSFGNCGNLFAILMLMEIRTEKFMEQSTEIETCYLMPIASLTSLSMKDQAKMSWDSINWMINVTSGRMSELTVTVHADVYAKMTGGTVDDWGSLGTLAEGKGVKLISYGESGYPFLTRVLWHGYKRLENKINAAKSGDVIYIHPDDRRKITAAQRDDWAALVTAGAEKQISFALPAEG